MVLLSGGEPFELEREKFISYIFQCVIHRKYFRLATGGHVDLSPHLSWLQSNIYFHGIQIGTDVIADGRDSQAADYYKVWRKNIKLLHQAKIWYALTITLSRDLALCSLLLRARIASPNIILLNLLNAKHYNYQEDLKKIKATFPQIEITYGYFG